ncbi:MAG: alkaline phosphatase PhoX [Pseudomonadales bacterium]|jgi:secreted PhoX family phosphatase|nr:alkaline phosphatase PhoX [Pseudomonadales bacterium]
MPANPRFLAHDSSRRSLLRRGVALGSGIALAPLFTGLSAANAEARGLGKGRPLRGTEELVPVADETTGLELLKLPRGFRYSTFGWTGDGMNDGSRTPDRHDGMAVVDADWRRGTVTLIRNHERGPIDTDFVPLIGDGSTPVYDGFALPGAVNGLGGGTTAVEYDLRAGRFVGATATLAGTLTNCAGGPTPWGSWLTCEEGVVSDPTDIFGQLFGRSLREHGYVYEVPAPRLGPASAVPIVAMGKMDHEAVAVDPRTSVVYLTEDNGPNSGFYRFLPDDRSRRIGSLERGGVLQMLRVAGTPNADLREPVQGAVFDVDWVTIDDPNLDPEELVSPGPGFPPVAGAGRSGPYLQGEAAGAARFQRGEGCWYHRGVVYWVDTSGGAAGQGVVWAYLPHREKLLALFVSPGEETANNPDNITVSRRGGIVVCEDGGSFTDAAGETVGARLLAVDRRGNARAFAQNTTVIDTVLPDRPWIPLDDYRSREFAGACFDPFGRTLFVNIQTPGITFAITGPFARFGL